MSLSPPIWKLSAAIFLAVSYALAPATASGQSVEEVKPGETEDGPRIRTLPPAYESEMLRLAEILGALHYLRPLCGADEPQTWRQQMQAMIDAEQPTEDRRARLISRFNRGYRGYREVYRECTPAAAEAANRYRRQGIRLAAEIPNRYGD